MKYPFLDLAAINAPFMEEMERAVSRVVRSGRYVGGDEVTKFEENLSALTGAPYAVGVSNGLDALRLSLRAMIIEGIIPPGSDVIVPANTYIASILAILDAGLVPILAEPDPATMNLDTDSLEQYLTSRTKAIMPVHLYGRVCWDARLKEFARRHSLVVIEDNAQAIGAFASEAGIYGHHMTGALGTVGAFSFYPTKNLGAMGDAGAIVCHDKKIADTVRALANYGSDRRYHNIYAGFNCRLDPVQAAVLNVKLPHLSHENERRRQNAEVYDRCISNPLIRKPQITLSPEESVWHQYVVRCDRRDDLQAWLGANGVGTDIHYAVPPHRQPCMQGSSTSHNYPVTDSIADSVLSLPISSATKKEDVEAISNILNSFN